MTSKISSSITELSKVEKEISITVPASEVKKHLDRAYTQIAKEARLPGFRPGKAPRALLEQKFQGSAVRHAVEDVVSHSLREVLTENKIVSANRPNITRIDELVPGKDFCYDVKLEVIPELAVANYDGLNLNVAKFEFGEEDIKRELESLQKMVAPYVEVAGRTTINEGDFVETQFFVNCEGAEVAALSQNEFALVGLAGEEVFTELRTAILSKSVPCEFSETFIISNDFYDEGLRGKPATITGSVKSIKELKLPALDDDFARDVSSQFTDLAALKEFIVKRLESEKAQRDKDALYSTVADALLKDNEVEVPPSMIEEQALDIAAQTLGQLDQKDAKEFWDANGEKLFEACKERAKRGLQVLMLCQAIADKETIQVTGEELSTEISKEISRRRLKQAEVSKLFTKERVQMFGQQMRADKALELVASRANITTEMHALHNG